MGKIELFVNSLDLSDIAASIVQEGSENFTVKLRRIGKAGRLSKQAQLLENALRPASVTWLTVRESIKQTKFPIVVYCKTKIGEQYAFPDAYLTFAPGKIGVRKKNKAISFTASINIGGGFVVPQQYQAELLRNIAQAGGVPRALIGQPVRIPRARHDDAAEAARLAWDGVAPYTVGMDAARVDAELTAFARRFADATGRSAADVENDIQNAIHLETSRAFTEGVQARIDLTLLEGDEAEGDE